MRAQQWLAKRLTGGQQGPIVNVFKAPSCMLFTLPVWEAHTAVAACKAQRVSRVCVYVCMPVSCMAATVRQAGALYATNGSTQMHVLSRAQQHAADLAVVQVRRRCVCDTYGTVLVLERHSQC